jgi:hypothetical protein
MSRRETRIVQDFLHSVMQFNVDLLEVNVGQELQQGVSETTGLSHFSWKYFCQTFPFC